MSFERWITRLASGRCGSYGDIDDPFVHVFREWGCLFLMRLAQTPQHLVLVAPASEIQPTKFLWRVGYGLESLVWDVEHSMTARAAAVAAVPAILEHSSPAAQADGGAYMLWDNVVGLRELRAVAGDEEQMVEVIRAAIIETLQSSHSNIRAGAELGLYRLETRT